jgi:hypothetical protein
MTHHHHHDNKNSNEFVNMIVLTGSDRENMRKISVLGLEDPVDKTATHRHSKVGDSRRIIEAEESVETMRKISRWGLEDPVDLITECIPSRGLKESHGRHRRPLSAGRTRQIHKNRDSAALGGVERSEFREMSRLAVQPAGTECRMPRGRELLRTSIATIDTDAPLVDTNHVPIEKVKAVRHRSLNLDDPFVTDESEGLDFPPIQVIIPEPEGKNLPSDHHHNQAAYVSVVEATAEKRHLMRMVSGLGMRDPVFGDIHKEMESSQSSIVYEDMEGIDEDEDKKDHHWAPTADLAQVLPQDIPFGGWQEQGFDQGSALEVYEPSAGTYPRRSSLNSQLVGSPPVLTTSSPVPKGRKSFIDCSFQQPQKDEEDHGYVPPSGSFVRRTSLRSEHSATPPAFSHSPQLPSGRKSLRDCFLPHPLNDWDGRGYVPPAGSFVRRPSQKAEFPASPIPSASKSVTRGSLQQTQKQVEEQKDTSSRRLSQGFVPPDGSFNVRKAKERASTPTRETLLKDMALAHTVQVIFHCDGLLSGSATGLEQTMSNLDASLRSLTLDEAQA